MDKIEHEIIKTYVKENNGTSFVSLSAPEFWVEVKPAFWVYE